MTDAELDAIEARLAAATTWPWYTGMSGNFWYVLDNSLTADSEGQVCSINRRHREEANCELIANAPTDLAALLAEVRLLRGLLSDAVLDKGPRRELVLMGRRQMREKAVGAVVKLLGECGGTSPAKPGLILASSFIGELGDHDD